MLKISEQVIIPISEIEMSAIRSQGAGGQRSQFLNGTVLR